MATQSILFMTALGLFGVSASFRFAGMLDMGAVLVQPGSLIGLNFKLRTHGVVVLSSLLFALLLVGQLNVSTSYIIASSLILFIFGMFDNLLGLLPKRKQYRPEIFGGLCHMLLSALFVAHLGNLLGTASFVIPLWFAVPVALFTVLSILKVIVLLEKATGNL